MAPAYYLVGGPNNIQTVGDAATRLHQSFAGALEFPERLFPQLAGRKMFWVQFDDIEAEDVETIRQDLSRDLSTQVWSITRNADGTHNFGPEPFGPDFIPGNIGARHEDPRPPRDREAARDPYADEYDDEDWGWDWEYPAPPPNRNHRRNTYANDYDLGDGNESAFEPFSHRSLRKGMYADYNDLDDEDEDDSELPPYRNRRGDMHTDFFDLDGEEENDFERFPRHSRRRNTYANDYDLDNGYEHEFEPYPHVGRRRDRYTSAYGGRGSSSGHSGYSRHRGPPSGTYPRALDSESWYGEAPERQQNRGHPHTSRTNRDREGPEPGGPYSNAGHRHVRERYRNGPAPGGVFDPERRTRRTRPEPRSICHLLRSFLSWRR